MKRFIAFFLLLALALPLVSCGRSGETAAQNGGSQPPTETSPDGEPPRPTPDPAAQAFDPETDYNNRYGALFNCTMLETDDAYYFTDGPFLMYYDKVMEESGYLCPKPECVHAEKRPNTDCNAYVSITRNSLVYREGQLWWVGDIDFRHFGLYRMNLDGTGRELVHEFEYTGDSRGMVRFYLHRDHLFYARSDQEVRQSEVYNTATFGCFDLDDYEKHILAVRRSTYTNPQPGIYFAGDSAYFFVHYADVDESEEIPDGEVDYEAWVEFWNRHKPINEILRWDPTMEEPETVYFNDEDGVYWGYNSYYAAEDGTVYFFDEEVLEGESTGLDRYNQYICTVGADGKKERVLTLIDEDGLHYCPEVISSGVVLALNWPEEGRSEGNIKAWVLKLSGETVFRGDLPMTYREKYTDIAKHWLGGLNDCWATETELMFRFTERYQGLGGHGSDMSYYDYVKYEITPDGLVEIPLIHYRAHFISDDDHTPDFGDKKYKFRKQHIERSII